MKITTLIEDTKEENSTLINEHGLSILIEIEGKNILFDTGKSGDFIGNARKLNIDLTKIDYIVLSHAHYDHTGGIRSLLDNLNINAEIYVSEHFFKNSDKYHILSSNGDSKYNGIDFDENYIINKNLKINYIKNNCFPLTSKVNIVTNFNRYCDFETINENLKVKINNETITDDFKDEVALTINTEKGLLVIVGCSHIGIINIITTIKNRNENKIYGIIGGTHLVEADDYRISKTLEYFKNIKVQLIGVSHCTGKKAIKHFKENADNFFVNDTGKFLEI